VWHFQIVFSSKAYDLKKGRKGQWEEIKGGRTRLGGKMRKKVKVTRT
jgi:hypothetical protein